MDAGVSVRVVMLHGQRGEPVSHRADALAGGDLGLLVLSGGHPAVAAVEAALATGDPRADGAVDLLCAHATGVLDRARTEVTPATQLSAMELLLRGG